MTEAAVVVGEDDEDDEDVGVLDLFEEPHESNKDPSVISPSVSVSAEGVHNLMADDTAETVTDDMRTLVSEQDLAASVSRTRNTPALEELTRATSTESPGHQKLSDNDQKARPSLSEPLLHVLTNPSQSPPVVVPVSPSLISPIPAQPSPVSVPLRLPVSEGAQKQEPGKPPLMFVANNLAMPPSQQICLCQQPARIPRPRNAFILFRQHNHAPVAADNPGKPNPEISKIIGQMWKSSGEDVKAIWQNHADEEKRQHLARYPQYRYQPRRNGKKSATAVSNPSTVSPTVETPICSRCGGRTGALSVVAASTSKRERTPQRPPTTRLSAARRNALTPDGDTHEQAIVENGSPIVEGGHQVGVEALLQLGALQSQGDGMPGKEEHNASKRRKLDISLRCPSITLSSTPLGDVHASLADDALRVRPAINMDMDAATEHDGSPGAAHQPLLYIENAIKTIPIITKIHAINRICRPISSSTVRLPVIAVEGEGPEASSLCRALTQEIGRSEHVLQIDEPISFVPNAEPFNVDGNRDVEDNNVAKYLTHVAFWRLKSAEIRKIVARPTVQELESDDRDGAPHSGSVVLINRYIPSQSECAAIHLPFSDGLSPLEHWKWCASLWRGCIGADMTIYAQTLPQGFVVGDDAVESKDKGSLVIVKRPADAQEWDDKIVRRLGFEVGEVVRSLMGFTIS